MRLEPGELTRYLEERYGESVQVHQMRQLGEEATGAAALKRFGYGRPLLVDYKAGDRRIQEVFHRIGRNAFGREVDDDRAAAVRLDYKTFNRLPCHKQNHPGPCSESSARRARHWRTAVGF